jgi:hypothetical protein
MRFDLLFNLTDERGRSAACTPSFSGSSVRDRLNIYRGIALTGATYQVQVVAQQYTSMSAEQDVGIKELFLQARRQLMTQLMSQMDKP